jgi:hypothetical protein
MIEISIHTQQELRRFEEGENEWKRQGSRAVNYHHAQAILRESKRNVPFVGFLRICEQAVIIGLHKWGKTLRCSFTETW